MRRFCAVLAVLLGLALALPGTAAAASPLGGGSPLVIGSNARCIAAFATTSGFLITGAGCGSQGAAVSSGGTAVGTVSSAKDTYTLIRVTNRADWTLVAWAGGGGVSVAGSTEAPVGSTVCLLGGSTRCGTVQAVNVTVNYPEGAISGLTQTSVTPDSGVRGGPFLAGNQAQGVLFGGSGGHGFFVPVNDILSANGLSLLTG